MSAITAALDASSTTVAAEGDLAPDPRLADPLELESAGDPIVLPDGRRIYPPRCTASRSTSSPARCWTWTTPRARASCA